MDAAKRKLIEAAGWKVGDAADGGGQHDQPGGEVPPGLQGRGHRDCQEGGRCALSLEELFSSL